MIVNINDDKKFWLKNVLFLTTWTLPSLAFTKVDKYSQTIKAVVDSRHLKVKLAQ